MTLSNGVRSLERGARLRDFRNVLIHSVEVREKLPITLASRTRVRYHHRGSGEAKNRQ